MDNQRFVEKVNPDVLNTAERKHQTHNVLPIFGGQTLKFYEGLERFKEHFQPGDPLLATSERRFKESLDRDRKFLYDFYLKSGGPDSISGNLIVKRSMQPLIDLLREGFEDRHLAGVCLRIEDRLFYERDEGKRHNPDFFTSDNISDELLLRLIQLHGQNYLKRNAELREKVPGLKDSFVDYFKEFAASKGIDISDKQIEERIQGADVVAADELVMRMDDLAGGYYAEDGKVRISIGVSSEQLPMVFAHEMLHVLSGRTVVVKGEYFENTSYSSSERVAQRIGLSFDEKIPRLGWLNEAITQELTGQIRPGYETYKKEQQLLSAIREVGNIESLLFYNAYFEDYDPSLPQGERIQHWKRLWHAINDAFEPGFMVKLDDKFKKEGFDAALGYIQSYRKDKSNVQS